MSKKSEALHILTLFCWQKIESAQKPSLDARVTNYLLRKIFFKLNLLNSETSADLSNYVQNGEWDLVRSKIFTIRTIKMLDVWTCNMCNRNLIIQMIKI